MKRIISVLLSFAIMLTALCIPAFAEGETGGSGNIDGGGGSMGDATSHGSWNPGNEGVRITVVRASNHAVVTTPFDLTNKQPAAVLYHQFKADMLTRTLLNRSPGLSAPTETTISRQSNDTFAPNML